MTEIAKDAPSMGSVHVNSPSGKISTVADDEAAASVGVSVAEKSAAPFAKADEPKRFVLGIVYEPNVLDSQGDFATAEEIERMCWDFNAKLQGRDEVAKAAMELFSELAKAEAGNYRLSIDADILKEVAEDPRLMRVRKGFLGIQHSAWDDDFGWIVESYIAPCDMTIGEQAIKQGTWMMGSIVSPEVWKKVKAGELTGYSMGGRAEKVEADLPK